MSSYSCVRSKSLTVPMPSQRGHMPPSRENERFSRVVLPPFSNVTAPAPLIVAVLNENACGEPMCGVPSRLKRMRSIALASVAVPTVERTLAPIRSWSTRIAVVRPSSTSTSGRPSVGMKPCTNELYVSLMRRCDSAAIVPNTSELLPDPDTPVNAVSRRFGISTLTSLRLLTRAAPPRGSGRVRRRRVAGWRERVSTDPPSSPWPSALLSPDRRRRSKLRRAHATFGARGMHFRAGEGSGPGGAGHATRPLTRSQRYDRTPLFFVP